MEKAQSQSLSGEGLGLGPGGGAQSQFLSCGVPQSWSFTRGRAPSQPWSFRDAQLCDQHWLKDAAPGSAAAGSCHGGPEHLHHHKERRGQPGAGGRGGGVLHVGPQAGWGRQWAGWGGGHHAEVGGVVAYWRKSYYFHLAICQKLLPFVLDKVLKRKNTNTQKFLTHVA